MKTPKRILVTHPDDHTRRLLTMLLVESGLTVHAVDPSLAAIKALDAERFDLALIGQANLDDQHFNLIEPLRRIQPDLPVVMLLPELQLPLVVQGIRHGFTDVLPLRTDPKPVLRRIMSLVGLQPEIEPSATELAEVEATLAQLDPSITATAVDQEFANQRDQLWRGLRELQLEREIILAAQAGMGEKARLLGEDREKLRREKQAFASEVAELRAEGVEMDRAWRDLEKQRDALRAERETFRETEQDLRRKEAHMATIPPMALKRTTGSLDELEEAWDALDRARAAMEAERSLFRDERMTIADLERTIKQREEQLRDLNEQVRDLDRKRRGLPHPPPKAFIKPAMANGARGRKLNLFKSLLGGRT